MAERTDRWAHLRWPPATRPQFRSVRLRAGNGSVLRRHASAGNQIFRRVGHLILQRLAIAPVLPCRFPHGPATRRRSWSADSGIRPPDRRPAFSSQAGSGHSSDPGRTKMAHFSRRLPLAEHNHAKVIWRRPDCYPAVHASFRPPDGGKPRPRGSAKLELWIRRNWERLWRCPILRWSCWSARPGPGSRCGRRSITARMRWSRRTGCALWWAVASTTWMHQPTPLPCLTR